MAESTKISSVFSQLQSQGEMAFMPFITAGDPDMETTLALIRELTTRGVHLIEIGFPYSDPIADGPVIQASYTRALNAGIHVDDIFSGIESLNHDETPPLVAMVSYAIVLRLGPENFLDRAKAAGFSGLIVPDLPADVADELPQLAGSRGLDLIQLIAPTTTDERVGRILKSATGFLYCISLAGTTGVRDELPEELKGQLDSLRAKTDLPLAVGFGISRPEQVEMLRGSAHGVIVGSGIVRHLESISKDSTTADEVVNAIGEFASEMVHAVAADDR